MFLIFNEYIKVVQQLIQQKIRQNQLLCFYESLEYNILKNPY
ncbi:hypothetical protein pb186bvf_018777 [Paramecium bursaria]